MLVLGIDGASFDLIQDWIKAGKLPFIKKMIKQGTMAPLRSTIPPITAPAIPSFITGKNPGKTGIYAFQTKSMSLVTSKDLAGSIFWESLSAKKINCTIISLPFSYPPQRLRGCMIADSRFIPSRKSDYIFPKELKSIAIDYPIGIPKRITDNRGRFVAKEELRNNKRDMLKKFEIATRILKKVDINQPNLFLLYINESDTVHHRILNEQKEVLDFYKSLESELENLIKKGDFRNVIIFSDHGNEPYPKYYFNINTWLEKTGFLKMRGGPILSKIILKLHELVDEISTLTKASRAMFLHFLKRAQAMGARAQTRGKGLSRESLMNILGIDMTKTKAYSTTPFGIRINREILGSEEEYKELRNELIKRLSELRDLKRKRKVIDEVYNRDEFYCGEFLEEFPDVLFLTNGYMPNLVPGLKSFDRISDRKRRNNEGSLLQGVHTSGRSKEGILIAYGEYFSQGKNIEQVKIWDIIPTILHIFDVSVPSDMDGKVIKEIFRQDSEIAKRPVNYRKFDKKEGNRIGKQKQVYSVEEEEQIKKRLQSLGYF